MNFAVDVTTAEVAPHQYESTCSCTCGWSLTTIEATSHMATRVSDRARANHFDDAHPHQRRYASQVTQAPEHGHTSALGGSRKDGFLWARAIVCACDWELTATGRTPLEAATSARAQHRRHVRDETTSWRGRDRLVLLGALAIIATVLVALAAVTINIAVR